MEYYSVIRGPTLSHHGIKGMRWGVRRDLHREHNGQKWDKKADKKQDEINKLVVKRGNSGAIKAAQINHKIAKLDKKKQQYEHNAELKRAGKFTTKQKIAIVGAAAVATYAVYKMADSGEFNRIADAGKKILGMDTNFKANKKNAEYSTQQEVFDNIVNKINPDYGKMGTTQNCRRCTFAYELSRRGNEVTATKTHGGTGQNFGGVWNATHKGNEVRSSVLGMMSRSTRELINGKATESDSFSVAANNFATKKIAPNKVLSDIVRNQPVGARGEIQYTWAGGRGGHSIAYEVFKDGPVIFDCQSNKRFRNSLELAEYTNHASEAAITRLDNVELNTDFLKKWMK